MIEIVYKSLKEAGQLIEQTLKTACAAYPTLMLILTIVVSLCVSIALCRLANLGDEEEMKEYKRRGWLGNPVQRRRMRRNQWREPLPPVWWEKKSWWRWK